MRFPFGWDEQESPSTQALTETLVEPEIDEASDEQTATTAYNVVDLPMNGLATLDSGCSVGEMPSEDLSETPSKVVMRVADLRPEDDCPPAEGFEPVGREEPEFSLETEIEPLSPPLPRPATKRKIIAFPRQAKRQEEVYRLADPVAPEQPRILDVPEELEPFPTTPLLEGLQLPAPQNGSVPSPDHIDLPFQGASVARRLSAGLVDFAVVVAASVVFGGVAYKVMPKLQLSKPLILGLAAVPLVLWAAYQYLMLMYAGTTAGMQATQLRLSTFKGGAPNRRHRRSRVVGLYFSTASLMMGLLWSLVDVDALCWHDRISHTYLTRRD
jgi:uncharacterized RDD family membrane protein YckC